MSNLIRVALVAAALGASSAAAAQRSTKLPGRPTADAARPFTFPAVTIDTLPNGLRFAIIENHELPLVTVRIGFEGSGPYGMWFIDPPGKEGAWGLLLASLREGTTTRSGAQITDELADLGTDFLATSSVSFLPPWFRAAKSTWTPSLKLVADMVMNPTVPADALARVQEGLATSLDRLPAISIANRLMYVTLYGTDSRYNHFATGASLRALKRDDLVALQREFLGPQNTMVVIAGDVSAAEGRKAMRETFGSWARSTGTMTPVVPAMPAPTPTTIYLRDMPGQANPQIVAAQIVPGRDHADAASIEALASVLGNFSVSAGSRVYRAFRTDRGLSYAPSEELRTRPIPETVTLVGRFAVPTAQVDTAVMTYLRVIRELKESKPVTESELEFSKSNLIGGLPMDLEQLDAVSLNQLSAFRDRLPPGYMNDWIRRISGLTVPQVQQAAVRFLDPDHTAIVVLGDRGKIEAALRGTGIPVVIIDR